MRLREWVKAEGHGAIAELARRAGVSASFLSTLVSEKRVVIEYPTAQRISDATGGAVSIEELCTAKRQRRRRAA